MDYQIKAISVEGFTDATGVHTNSDGDWLGEFIKCDEAGNVVNRMELYSDEDGEYVPAPNGWQSEIIAGE